MHRLFVSALVVFFSATALLAEPANLLPKANVLPLAIDDAIKFRKTKIFYNDPAFLKPTQDAMLNFERQRINFGAVTAYDRLQRYGHYYTFSWRADRQADLTLRFEYRQDKLGAYVQAQERTYAGVKGSVTSKFSVIGDDYVNDGRVTSWRAILIENGKIVALNQSYLWR